MNERNVNWIPGIVDRSNNGSLLFLGTCPLVLQVLILKLIQGSNLEQSEVYKQSVPKHI